MELQEIIFSSSDPATSRAISKMVKEGVLRKIAPRVYSSNFKEEPSVVIRRNIFRIIGHLYPGAILSHRSALEFKPTSTQQLFLTYSYDRIIKLPGVILNMMKGPDNTYGVRLFSEGLYVSQFERALLENLQPSRKTGEDSKNLDSNQIEAKLDEIARIKGEEGLNEVRDQARKLSNQLNFHNEFEKLDKMIGALLQTKPSSILKSSVARARSFGHPYDLHRMSLFEKLFVALDQGVFEIFPDKNQSTSAFRNFAFYEAYFSNFIEGTQFEVSEAKTIIDTGISMPARHEESHDILGTFQIVSDPEEMRIVPQSGEHLLEIIQRRHQILMAARTTKNPGQFKDLNNRAGNTFFVDKALVKGTLLEGFNFLRALQHPFAKAAYIMFLISEVHPFLDGNGRLARIMMNAELVQGNQTRIIIPTVYREDYLGALRQLSRKSNTDVYIKMLYRAWKFSTTIDSADMEVTESTLKTSNAFQEEGDFILKF